MPETTRTTAPRPRRSQVDQTDQPDRAGQTALDRVDALLPRLVVSAEPAVLFASLVALCVPTMGDACAVDIVEGGGTSYRLGHAPDRPMVRISTSFRSPTRDPASPYSGNLLLAWDSRIVTAAEVASARVMVDHAVAVITQERLVADAAQARHSAAHLRLALANSRTIGSAIGILMYRHTITDRVAFELLRGASQHTNRKLHEVAAEVVDTGQLEGV